MIPRPPAFRGDLIDDPARTDPWSGASGPFFRAPRAVAHPLDVDSVAALVRWAVQHGIPLIPRGAGTGMPGGNVGDGVVLDLRHLDRVSVVAPGLVHAEAGATAASARATAREVGRDLPALPSSAEWCTVGGIAANDAAGARSFLYGPAHDWIEALDVVGPDATPRTVRRGDTIDDTGARLREALTAMLPGPLAWPDVRKNASGYALDRFLRSGDVVDLWIGSEGTLGVITGVHLRTTSVPSERGVALLGVPERSALPRLVALASDVGATACEWFGSRLIDLGGLGDDERLRGLDRAYGVCLIEVAGPTPADVDARLTEVAQRADSIGGVRTTSDASRIDAFWSLRHDASPRIEALAGRSRRSTQFIEDCVVPVSALPAWLDGLERILASHDVDAVLFGHAGDGNIHVNPLLDLTDPSWRGVARSVLDEVVELVARLGGTLSGEHGDGRLRAPFVEKIWGADVTRAFECVKRTLDPTGVFNPGVILPLPGQDPLEGFGEAPDFAERNRGPVRRRTAATSEAT
ncbi:MAG TPA: FAD-binding oxidoreductase [Longimicrobiales bacterium]|nr:FAD-binding oxidoreductase [Longimicrobiales bacterium]